MAERRRLLGLVVEPSLKFLFPRVHGNKETMANRKRKNAGQPRKLRLPKKNEGEILGRVIEILGNDHMRVLCEDGKVRLGRIRGKIKKRMWIRLGEVVVVVPWDPRDEVDGQGRCEIIWRYRKTQEHQLVRKGVLPESLREQGEEAQP
ncbi:MAG: hypothetical protein Kow0069_37300 [Promethearchaeota archaeon]